MAAAALSLYQNGHQHLQVVGWEAMGEVANAVFSEAAYSLVKILTPVTPHLAESLWESFAADGAGLEDAWLSVDESALERDEITYVVQVNGKLRGKMSVAASAAKDEIEALAQQDENVQRFLDGLTVRKIIVVPNKLVNIVAN